MRLLTTFAAFVPLCTFALAQRTVWENVACSWYDARRVGSDGFVWDNFGELKDGVANNIEVNKSGWKNVDQDKGGGSNTRTWYHYTLHGGLGKFHPTDRNAMVFYAQADRTTGKGLGQAFRVNFHGQDDKILTSYWIKPQQKCTIEPGSIVPSQIKRVTANFIVY